MNAPAPTSGQLVGEAACAFAESWQACVRGLLLLDLAGLEPTDEMADLIEDIAMLPDAVIALADAIGHAATQKVGDE